MPEKDGRTRGKKRRGSERESKSGASFAEGLNFYKLFWVFFIGSFLGVVIEVLFCLATQHRLESRTGLVYGPFNLVYGFGALAITLGLYWLRNQRDLWIFLGGILLGGAFEYLCSWFQEMVFGTVSWEYSYMRFNLNGRVNLLYSIFWGFLALLWLKDTFPRISGAIERIPNKIGKPLTWALVVFMLFNTVMSAAAVARQTDRRAGIEASNSFEVYLDEHFDDEKLKEIYPNMQVVE